MGDAKEKGKVFTSIKKRDGRVELFEAEKITRAISKAGAATGEFGDKIAQKLTLKVLNLAQQAIPSEIPTVEEIQDVVEEVLLSSPYRKTAKAYIIYREQHAGIRELTAKADVDLVDQYLERIDWQVNENSNMSFSLQGLNNYVSSEISKIYWMRKIYPPEVRQAHSGGDFHIHDLNLLSVYCVGWDLFDLLVEGFKGAQGKIESKPAKHLRSALGQIVNFFYTLQGEAAGAQAFSNFDTLLAPFIRYDGLGYKEVKQALQEFVFNINVPTRVGFQCMSEDTEILGENGWKRYNQVKEGDVIATFNIEKGFIEYLPVRHVFAREYRGMMYNLKNRISDQLISPEHRVVRRRFGAEGYTLEKIEKVYDLKSPFMVPVGSEGKMQGNNWVDKDVIKLIAWVIAEGTIDRSGRISIYQSKGENRKNYDEILSLCSSLKLKYTERAQKGLGNCNVIRFDADSTRKILQYFKTNKNKFRGIKFIPDTIINADAETARLFLETYIKGDGHGGCKITDTSAVIKDGLMQVIVNAGYGATVLTRKPDNAVSKKDRYIIRIIKHKDTYINTVKKVNYSGVIWCPNTDNETVIARRNGKIFITGNTPFTNITLDLTVPEYYANQGVIIGGEIQKGTYKEFQPEMELFNKALLEVMAEGDAKGRVFSIDGACSCLVKNSGKMRLIKIGDYIDGFMEKGKPIYIKENNCQILDVRKSDINCLGLKEGKIDWQKVNFLVRHPLKNLLRICTQGGFSIKVTPSHSVLVLKEGEIQSFEAEKLKEGDYLIAPKVIPLGENKTSKFSLAEEFLKKGKAQGIYIRKASKNKEPSVFPLINMAEGLEEFKFSKLKLKLAGSSIELSNDLPITKELVEFLGWYCAEGSAEKSEKYGGISLGFNLKEEKQTAYHIAKLIEKIWPGIPVHSREIEERNLIEVRIHSKLLRRIITEIFEVGNNTDKRVPQIIFELSPEMKRIFLNAYFKGDAWLTENIVVNSISRELIYGISVLLKQLDVFHTLTEYDWRGRPRWRINIWQNRELKAKNSRTISKIPITESGLEKIVEKISENEPYFFDSLGRRYKNTKNRIFQKFGISHQTSTSLEKAKRIIKLAEESGIEIPPALREIEKNELSCLKIKKIEKTLSSNGMVYDFSTESENFVADQFLVHNTFPIPTYNITRDFDWGNPNLDVLWEVTAKYGVPYFSNFINSDMNPEDARSMCCRLRIDNRELKKRGGGLFGSSPLTGCYDEKTEIMTEDGWKFFKDLKMEDKVFTLTEDNQIELHQPLKLFEYDYEGEMIKFEARSFDLLVTPNHRMVVDHKYKNKRTFVEAEEFNPRQHLIPKGGIWEGNEQEYFELPAIAIIQGAGPISHFSDQELESIRKKRSFNCNPVTVYNVCTKGNYGNRERVRIRYEAPSLKIKMDDWLKFFGFWIAEGSTDNEKNALDHGYRVIISQANKQKRQEIIDILDKLSFNYYLDGDNIIISNKQLWNYLRQFGNKYTKFIPKEIKNLSKRQLKILFDWMVKGDGHIRKTTGQINYWTASKKLADDLQEIILKLGCMGTLTIQKSKTSEIKGRKIKAGIVYNIGVQKTKHYRFREKNLSQVFYKGEVYCCEVPNHSVYVRRNGKVSWCGNSIGVVTLNMPRLGYLAKDEDEFIEALERLMVLARESLEVKRKVLEHFTEESLYPYTRYYLRGVKERFGEYWKNHFSTIGLVGMNEACLNMFGEPIASEKSREFTSRVLDFMRDKLLKFQAETGNNYNLEATPAEGTSYRLAKKDKEKYPGIICANEAEWKRGAEPFYTNSTQLPVNYTEDVFEALDLQDEIQTKYTGGCLEAGNKVLTDKGLLKIEEIVKDFTALKPIKALSYNPEEGISEWDEITDVVTVNLKRQNKIRVKGERGLDIVTSDWHPFFILKRVKPNPVCPVCGCGVKNIKSFATHLRWNPECRMKYRAMPKYQVEERRADELKVGDYILQNSCNLYPERETELNPDLMWLIGFFIGDGSVSEFVDNRGGSKLKKYKVRFSSEQQAALRKAAKILNKYFGCNCKVKVIQNDKRNEPLREVTTSKKEVAVFFLKRGFTPGKKVYNISIPNEVKDEISCGNVYSLLSGLGDSDGHIGKRGGDFEYSTVSSKLAEDILEICTRAGIMVSKRKIKNQLSITVNKSRIKRDLSNRKKRYLPVVRVKEVSKEEVQDNQFYDLTTQKNHNYLAGRDTFVFVHNTVFHVFAGERVSDYNTLRELIRKICELYHLPYFTFTPTFSICPTHGYIAGEHYTCPECGAETEVYSRVVGYLRPVTQWNKGKREEFKLRKTFVVEAEAETVQKSKEKGGRKAGITLKPPRVKAKAKRKYPGKQLNLVDFGGVDNKGD